MPVLGGATEVVERGLTPAQELVALAVALELELAVGGKASRAAKSSTWIEWSITSSPAAAG